jgi:hypothetical protein
LQKAGTGGKNMHINLEAFNARAGFRGIIVVSLALLMVSAFGQPGTVLAISAIFVSLADNPGPYTARFKRIGEFTLLGASVTLLAWVFGGGMWAVVISTLLITFTCGMALSYGSMIAIPAVLLNLWYVTAIPMVDPIELWQAVFGFIGGGLLVAIVATLNTVIYSLWQKGEEEEGKAEPDLEASSEEAVEEATEEAEEEMSGTAAEEANEKAGETVRTETGTETEGTEEEKTGGARKADLRANLRWTSPVFQFSTVKSLAGGLSTLAGWLIVSGHPFWAAYAPLAIIKPDVHQTTVSGVQRIVGTVIDELWFCSSFFHYDFIYNGEYILSAEYKWGAGFPQSQKSIASRPLFAVLLIAFSGCVDDNTPVIQFRGIRRGRNPLWEQTKWIRLIW